jgi:hypothetical protein
MKLVIRNATAAAAQHLVIEALHDAEAGKAECIESGSGFVPKCEL